MRVITGEYSQAVVADPQLGSPRPSWDAEAEAEDELQDANKKLTKKVSKIEKQMAAQQLQLEGLSAQNEKILELLHQMSI
jgi:hypothetical protein